MKHIRACGENSIFDESMLRRRAMAFNMVEQAEKESVKSDFINEQQPNDFGKSGQKAFNIGICMPLGVLRALWK